MSRSDGSDEAARTAPSRIEQGSELAGDPDGYDRLWTPHRMVYIGGQDKPVGDSVEECPFCRAPGRTDTDALLVARGTHAYVLLNLYPYNSGHLMVVPYRHVAGFPDLDVDETAEVALRTQTAMRVLQQVMSPQGFNLGMNQGAVAGAGITAHLHQHVVPRWAGDANFLPIIGRTKALPELLGETRERLAAAWPAPMKG